MLIWRRMRDAWLKEKGVRLSFEELQLLQNVDGNVITAFGRVDQEDEEREEKALGSVVGRGLTDKLYWRFTGRWHCFTRVEGGGYISLCGNHSLKRSGGQSSRRPEPILRCGRCDNLEMDRRGWAESGPTLEPQLTREDFR